MDQKLKIVITGATGFIGQHLLEDLDAFKYDITIISRNPSKAMRIQSSNIKIIVADLMDLNSLRKAFLNQDVLINLAAEVRDPDKLSETNINGTKNIVQAVKECKVSNIIHLSSCGVVGKSYSDDPKTILETTACTPQIEYEITKHISEKLFLEAKIKHPFKLTILRPTNVFGEYHSFNALLRMMRYLNTGLKIIAYKKTAMVNYVYVKDLTGLICNLIESQAEKGIVNVGHPEKIENFFFIITQQLNVKVKSIIIPAIIIKFVQLLGIKKIRPITNEVRYSDKKLESFYTYPYGTNKGLRRTIEHYKKLELLK